jgi:hypothetical protein
MAASPVPDFSKDERRTACSAPFVPQPVSSLFVSDGAKRVDQADGLALRLRLAGQLIDRRLPPERLAAQGALHCGDLEQAAAHEMGARLAAGAACGAGARQPERGEQSGMGQLYVTRQRDFHLDGRIGFDTTLNRRDDAVHHGKRFVP